MFFRNIYKGFAYISLNIGIIGIVKEKLMVEKLTTQFKIGEVLKFSIYK